jgi:hypothetical protein
LQCLNSYWKSSFCFCKMIFLLGFRFTSVSHSRVMGCESTGDLVVLSRDPHGPTALTRTFSFTQDRRVKELFQLLSGVLNTHRYLLPRSPLFLAGNRVSRYRETRRHSSRANQNPEPRWSKSQCFRPGRGFPYREIDTCFVAIHSPLKSPNLELRCTCAPIPRHVTSSLCSIGNRGIAISPVAIPLHNETPNVET